LALVELVGLLLQVQLELMALTLVSEFFQLQLVVVEAANLELSVTARLAVQAVVVMVTVLH
jgi:hypothetical protein